MARSFRAKAISYPIFAGIIIAIAWYILAATTGIFSLQWFSDRATVAAYQPSIAITELVATSGMNDNGEFYFYTGTPELNNNAEFNVNCADVMDEQSIVLGCYDGKIYIFDVTDERIAGVKSVTAAHEMLHAAYDRLGLFEKDYIDNLINEQLTVTTDQKILDLVVAYDRLEPGYRTNELHSIFGTEVMDLSDELSQYYDRYFSDRARVVTATEQYEAVFYELEQQAAEIESQMISLESEIREMTNEYEIEYNQLSYDIDVFNAAIYTDEGAFYSRRNALLARQDQLNAQVEIINTKISQYNELVESLKSLGREAELLQNNINSQSGLN